MQHFCWIRLRDLVVGLLWLGYAGALPDSVAQYSVDIR